MIKGLSEMETRLFALLETIPPQLEETERFLEENRLTAESVTKVGIWYAERCFCEAGDVRDEGISNPTAVIPDLHSTYIYEVTELLLRYGLDPNAVYGQSNVLYELQYVDNEFLAADTLALLFEHGADPNLTVDGESFFDLIHFDAFFDALEQYDRIRYASHIHFWMVMLGYGADRLAPPVQCQLFREYDYDACNEPLFTLDKLRDHRKYAFCVIHGEEGTEICIFDKDTLWEVARF